MTRIKICGLGRREDIAYINEARPDYCGFIIDVPFSRRTVTVETLKRLRTEIAEGIQVVGVFVNAAPELPISLLNGGVIDIAQLHGQEDETYVREIQLQTGKPVIKAFSAAGPEDIRRANESGADYVLFDHGKGGTGKCFDWKLLEEARKPFFLAGGLSAENLPEAIGRFHPWAVDLSSSVETDGKKDREKILAATAVVRRFGKLVTSTPRM